MTTFEPPPVPFPDPAWGVEILPATSTARWYAPDGVTRITTTEANYLLGSNENQTATTRVQDWTVSTIFLALDYSWALDWLGIDRQELRVPVLWETAVFTGHRPDHPSELPDTVTDYLQGRHSSLAEAKAWHAEAVVAVADYLGAAPADVAPDERFAHTAAAEGRRVWWT